MLLLILAFLACGGCVVKDQNDNETGKNESVKEDTSANDTAEDTANKK